MATEINETTTGTEHALLEDALRRSAEQNRAVENGTGQHSVYARVTRTDECFRVLDLEGTLDQPRRPRGTAEVHDWADFVRLVQRWRSEATVVYADERRSEVSAVLNDHIGLWQDTGHETDTGEPVAGWRDHRAVLALQDDPEWTAWLKRDGAAMTQTEFALWLEDHAHVVVQPEKDSPAAAEIMAVALDFKQHSTAEFGSSVDLSNGMLTVQYSHKTKGNGEIGMPQRFTIALTPFVGYPPVPVTVRVRTSVHGSNLSFGYQLLRPDNVRRDAFAWIKNQIHTELNKVSLPVVLGRAPEPVNPR